MWWGIRPKPQDPLALAATSHYAKRIEHSTNADEIAEREHLMHAHEAMGLNWLTGDFSRTAILARALRAERDDPDEPVA